MKLTKNSCVLHRKQGQTVIHHGYQTISKSFQWWRENIHSAFLTTALADSAPAVNTATLNCKQWKTAASRHETNACLYVTLVLWWHYSLQNNYWHCYFNAMEILTSYLSIIIESLLTSNPITHYSQSLKLFCTVHCTMKIWSWDASNPRSHLFRRGLIARKHIFGKTKKCVNFVVILQSSLGVHTALLHCAVCPMLVHLMPALYQLW